MYYSLKFERLPKRPDLSDATSVPHFIAASIEDKTPKDRFKIKRVEVRTPETGFYQNTAVVTAGIKFADADAIPLDFRLIQRNEKWLLFDVTFSGVSLARTFRSDFNYVAKDGGIDAVTTHLNRRREGFTP